jgi:amidohydrolase
MAAVSRSVPRSGAVVDAWLQEAAPGDVEAEGNGNGHSFERELRSEASRLLLQDIHQRAVSLNDTLVNWRRTLHRCPELMYQEEQTSAYIQQVLGELDIRYTAGWGKNIHEPPSQPSTDEKKEGAEDIRYIDGPGGYGVVADLGTGQEPCVLLRADMDALPILEQTPGIAEFASRNQGRMHACGHDGHTAMLLGAASLLKGMEGSIPGTVRLVFQPAEEGGAGAKRMIEEGVLSKAPRPSQGFAMHVWPYLPSGTIAGRPGPLLAAQERFEIVIEGVGGHAAMPHLTVSTLYRRRLPAPRCLFSRHTRQLRSPHPLLTFSWNVDTARLS